MSDPIDDLLDHSAPTLADRGSARDAALAQMVRDARDTVRPQKRSRRRVTVFAGLAAAVLISAGGAAVATGFVNWPERYQEPENVLAFQLSSGRQCESRFVIADAETAEPLRNPDTERVRRWLMSADLRAVMDMDAARARDAQVTRQSPDQTVVIGPEGWLMDVPEPPESRSADDIEARLIDFALDDVIYAELVEAGIDLNDWTILGGIKCAV